MDTETLGISTLSSYPFQVAVILEVQNNVKTELFKKEYKFNPFDISGAILEEGSTETHGYTESDIRSFPTSSADFVKEFVKVLENMILYNDGSKPYFVAYNSRFDYDQMRRLFLQYGYNFSSYFGGVFDAYKQTKIARVKGMLPTEIFTHNFSETYGDTYSIKLGNLIKYLNIDNEKCHDALGDITATYKASKRLEELGVPITLTAWKGMY